MVENEAEIFKDSEGALDSNKMKSNAKEGANRLADYVKRLESFDENLEKMSDDFNQAKEKCASFKMFVINTITDVLSKFEGEMEKEIAIKQGEIRGTIEKIRNLINNYGELKARCVEFDEKAENAKNDYKDIKESYEPAGEKFKVYSNYLDKIKKRKEEMLSKLEDKKKIDAFNATLEDLIKDFFPVKDSSKVQEVDFNHIYRIDSINETLYLFNINTCTGKIIDLDLKKNASLVLKDSGSLIHGNQIIITGGFDKKYYESCHTYFTVSNEVKKEQNILEERAEHTMIVVRNWLYILGGKNSKGYLKSCEKAYLRLEEDKAVSKNSLKWEKAPELIEAKAKVSACVSSKGAIYVFGGINEKNGEYTTYGSIERLKVVQVENATWDNLEVVINLTGCSFTTMISQYKGKEGIYVFGGANDYEEPMSKVHFLELELENVSNTAKLVNSLSSGMKDYYASYHPIIDKNKKVWVTGYNQFHEALIPNDAKAQPQWEKHLNFEYFSKQHCLS